MQLLKFIYLKTILSITILQFQYLNSEQCQGPPESLIAFKVKDLESGTHDIDENWPNFFEMMISETGYYDSCGSAPLTTKDQCCFLSLSLNDSNQYKSGKTRLTKQNDSNTFLNSMPIDSNGYQYCNITIKDVNAIGYEFQMYLANNLCIDNQYICHYNQEFEIFKEFNCQGESKILKIQESIEMNQQIYHYENFIEIVGGNSKTIWLARIPSKLLIPNTLNWLDCIHHVLYFILCITVTISFYNSIKELLKKRKMLKYVQTIIQGILLVQCVLFTIYGYNSQGTVQDQSMMAQIIYSLLNIITLLSVIQNWYILIQILHIQKMVVKLGIIFIIIIFHIILSGSNYLAYCWQPDISWCPNLTLLNHWYNLTPYWFILMFIWNNLSCILMMINMIQLYFKTNQIMNSLMELNRIDSRFILLIILQLLLICGYFIVGILYGYTNILGDDKWSMIMLILQQLILVLHFILNSKISNRMIIVIHNLAEFNQNVKVVTNTNQKVGLNVKDSKTNYKNTM
ncbi:hypothetical protein BC833DRAFT_599192, partial [Globomyces pollinis-pini]